MGEFTVRDMRAALKQLRGRSIKPKNLKMPLRNDIRLTVGGVVWIPGVGFMHPKTFKDIAGQKAYKHLLSLPRIVTSYDTEDECSLP